MTPGLRQSLIRWHRWIALGLAAFLLLQAISGLMIAFKDEASRTLHPRAMRSAAFGPRIDPDWAFESALSAAGPCEPERLYFPKYADGVFLLRCRDASNAVRFASVDAVTGNVLAAGSIWTFPFEAADLLHLDLTGGQVGRNFVGALGLILATIAAFGFVAWWPGAARVGRALRIPWRGTTRQKLVQLHRTAGALLALALMLVAASGATVAFHPVLEQVLERWLPFTKAPKFEHGLADAHLMSYAAMEQRALQLFPGDSVRDIRVAGAPAKALVVLNPAQPLHPRAVDRVWINRADGTAIAVAAKDEPSGSRALGWILPVHTGEILGMVGRLLSFVTGLGLLGLLVSGCATWVLGRVRKRAVNHSFTRSLLVDAETPRPHERERRGGE